MSLNARIVEAVMLLISIDNRECWLPAVSNNNIAEHVHYADATLQNIFNVRLQTQQKNKPPFEDFI